MNPDCEPLIQIVLLPCLVATLLFSQINIPSHNSLWGSTFLDTPQRQYAVPSSGRLYGWNWNRPFAISAPLQSVQIPVNFLCQRTADAIRLLQFFNTCGLHAFQPAKPRQQALTTLGADTINFL